MDTPTIYHTSRMDGKSNARGFSPLYGININSALRGAKERNTMTIQWGDVTKEDLFIIEDIVKKAVTMNPQVDVTGLEMDITAAHISGCPLKLEELKNAEPGDFLHDVFGIIRNIDRETGLLQNCFRPRYSKGGAYNGANKTTGY